jgi:hypothetical protein
MIASTAPNDTAANVTTTSSSRSPNRVLGGGRKIAASEPSKSTSLRYLGREFISHGIVQSPMVWTPKQYVPFCATKQQAALPTIDRPLSLETGTLEIS